MESSGRKFKKQTLSKVSFHVFPFMHGVSFLSSISTVAAIFSPSGLTKNS